MVLRIFYSISVNGACGASSLRTLTPSLGGSAQEITPDYRWTKPHLYRPSLMAHSVVEAETMVFPEKCSTRAVVCLCVGSNRTLWTMTKWTPLNTESASFINCAVPSLQH